MVTCFGNFSPLCDECRICPVKARCATRTTYDGFGILLHPRYNGVDLSYRESPTTHDDRVEKTLARISKAGFTVRGPRVFTGGGRTFAKVALRHGYLAVYFFDLFPGRVMYVSTSDNVEVLTWRKRCDTALIEKGCVALCSTARVASVLVRDVAVSLSHD